MLRNRRGQPVLAVLAVLSWSFVANAQSLDVGAKAEGQTSTSTEAESAAAVEEQPAPAEQPVQEAQPEPVPEPQPEPEPEPEPSVEKGEEGEEEEKPTDHESVVGSLGVGLLGSVQVRNTNAGFGAQNSLVPIIGARYWLSEFLGVQAGFGLTATSGVRKDDIAQNQKTFDSNQWNMAFHGAAPLSLFDGAHYNFVVIPELNLGYSTGRTKDDANIPGDQGFKQAAWMFSGGVRAGAEVQFGFIGIPQLSLQGAVGLNVTYQTAMIESVENGTTVRRNRQWFSAGTAKYNDPWDFFAGTISALYYFDL